MTRRTRYLNSGAYREKRGNHRRECFTNIPTSVIGPNIRIYDQCIFIYDNVDVSTYPELTSVDLDLKSSIEGLRPLVYCARPIPLNDVKNYFTQNR